MKSVAVIGGGAAGLTAAIFAKRKNPYIDVYILERNKMIGKKILSTGNGRCNLTNLDLKSSFYRTDSGENISNIFNIFGLHDTFRFFRSMGLCLTDKNGYVYPRSNTALSVLECLTLEIERLGIRVINEEKVLSISPKKKSIQICTDSNTYFADHVILTCGGKAGMNTGSDGSGFPLAASIGHRIIPVVPALVPLTVGQNPLKNAAGVRTRAKISYKTLSNNLVSDEGELQLTKSGISGIPVFQISRFVSKDLIPESSRPVFIDFLPDFNDETLLHDFEVRKSSFPDLFITHFLDGYFPPKLCECLASMGKFKKRKTLGATTHEEAKQLFHMVKHFSITVTKAGTFEQAQVTAGGVDITEIDLTTMQSMKNPRLYFAGEIMDVDGICGGYNLQWAWSSGAIAGSNAATFEE